MRICSVEMYDMYIFVWYHQLLLTHTDLLKTLTPNFHSVYYCHLLFFLVFFNIKVPVLGTMLTLLMHWCYNQHIVLEKKIKLAKWTSYASQEITHKIITLASNFKRIGKFSFFNVLFVSKEMKIISVICQLFESLWVSDTLGSCIFSVLPYELIYTCMYILDLPCIAVEYTTHVIL